MMLYELREMGGGCGAVGALEQFLEDVFGLEEREGAAVMVSEQAKGRADHKLEMMFFEHLPKEEQHSQFPATANRAPFFFNITTWA